VVQVRFECLQCLFFFFFFCKSRLHWMQMTSDKPILPVVTASVSTTTNATPVPSASSETQADTATGL
jgi:hypothetical protein